MSLHVEVSTATLGHGGTPRPSGLRAVVRAAFPAAAISVRQRSLIRLISARCFRLVSTSWPSMLQVARPPCGSGGCRCGPRSGTLLAGRCRWAASALMNPRRTWFLLVSSVFFHLLALVQPLAM